MSYQEQNARPFPVDAYNHFRITHPDRDLRPIIRRIHKLASPNALQTPYEETEGEVGATGVDLADSAHEKELVRLDLLRWKSTVERVMGSVRNLDNQTRVFQQEIQKTTGAKTAASRSMIEEEKSVLTRKRKERDEMVECDKITKKIKARGETRVELDEQIAQLRQSIEVHKATHEAYVATARDRASRFKDIIALVGEVKDIKLPDTATPDDVPDKDPDAMDVDDLPETRPPANTSLATNPRLNGAALPFQPTPANAGSSSHANGTSSTPVTRSSTPAPGQGAGGRHNLPARPGRMGSGTGRSAAGPGAPSRPSNLRSTTGGRSMGTGNLEEGEVGGDEEGEVKDRSSATKRDERPARPTRNQR